MVPKLTTAQRDDFERDGFLILRGFFPPERMTAVGGAINALAARPPRIGREMTYFENSVSTPGQRVLSRIERFIEESPALADFILGSGLTELAGEVLRAPAVLFKEKINFKLPNSQGFAPHQDIQPGWDTYASYFVSVLVTIDPSTEANGCIELAAGHHQRGWLGERMKPLTPEQLVGIAFTKYPTAPGDVVIFDCFTPHQSAPNRTTRARRNLYLTYNRAAEGDFRRRYFADKRAAFPPDNERKPGQHFSFKV
ncbi:MAG: phytanoyl-CoA dioxygenase family protein [Opitutaceae bacterium]|nr:phytanoyl-CoA dioxygenase family protein [Opitutaceae bacterium]